MGQADVERRNPGSGNRAQGAGVTRRSGGERCREEEDAAFQY